MNKPYCVDLCGSDDPVANDDCWTGEDFATLAEAEATFNDPALTFSDSNLLGDGPLFVILDGPGVHKVRKVRSTRRRPERDDWAQERAMQAGMAFGCAGFNDEMGW